MTFVKMLLISNFLVIKFEYLSIYKEETSEQHIEISLNIDNI